MGVTEIVLELQEHKAKIKGVSKRLLHCYSNLLCQKNDHNWDRREASRFARNFDLEKRHYG